jgi:tRNA(fMet)-specific endonuclease VapC
MLVDTDIVSFFYKKDSRAKPYERHVKGQTLFVSFISVAELYRWPFERNWGEAKKQELMQYLKNYTVLPYDDALAWTWAELVGKTCRDRPMALHDSWIAATALRHSLPIVTHNRKHFEHVPGLTVISES